MTCRRSAALAAALSIVFVVVAVSSANVVAVQNELDPRDAYVLLQEGQLHLWRGNNPEQALSNFERIINDYPTSRQVPVARLRKMMALENLGRTQDALKCAAEMIKDYPGQTIAAWAQAQIGHVYMGLGDNESAERELLKVEQQYGQLPDKGPLDQSRKDLGRIYLAAEKAAEAEKAASAAAPEQPAPEAADNAAPPETVESTTTQPSASEPAADTPETTVKPAEPSDPKAEARRTACIAVACVSDGDLAKALALYSELKSAHPEAVEYIAWVAFELAAKLLEQGSVTSEEEHLRLQELLRTPETLAPQDSFHVIKTALDYDRYCTIYGIWSGGKPYRSYEIAAEMLERMLTLYPGSSLVPEVLSRLAHDYQAMNRDDKAIETFNRVISEYPDSDRWFTEALYSVASIYANQPGQSAKAAEYYEKLIASTRDLIMVRDTMSRLERTCRALGNDDRADEILEEHVQLLEWSLTDPGIYFEQSLRNEWERDLSSLKARLAQRASSDPDVDSSDR